MGLRNSRLFAVFAVFMDLVGSDTDILGHSLLR